MLSSNAGISTFAISLVMEDAVKLSGETGIGDRPVDTDEPAEVWRDDGGEMEVTEIFRLLAIIGDKSPFWVRNSTILLDSIIG